MNIKEKLEEAKQAAETIADDVIKAQLEYLRDHPNIGELDDPNAIPGEWPLQYDEDNPGQGRCMHSQHELHYHPSQFPKSKEPQGNHDPTQPGWTGKPSYFVECDPKRLTKYEDNRYSLDTSIEVADLSWQVLPPTSYSHSKWSRNIHYTTLVQHMIHELMCSDKSMRRFIVADLGFNTSVIAMKFLTWVHLLITG